MGVADRSQTNHVRYALPPEKGMADTPELLADALVRAVSECPSGSWLDPCAGSGRLVSACLRAGVSRQSIVAIDLHKNLPMLEALGVKPILGVDFLHWATQTGRRFDRVIANPPFVSARELDEALLGPALETQARGIHVLPTANYWVAFLLAGLRLLKPGGCLAYILPAAWEYANYAGTLRNLCSVSFEELDVHRVAVPMFDEVNDGSVLLVGRGFGKRPHRRARVMRHETLAALSDAVCRSEVLTSAVPMRLDEDARLPEGQVRLGEIAQIRIGAVTGDVSFFLLDESRRLHFGLPSSAVRPVLSKARHIMGSEINYKIWQGLQSIGERVWLFDPSESDLSNSAVLQYLDLPLRDGGCRRDATKIRGRRPWYRVPIPRSFDGFMTGMSQSRTWIALNLMPGLTISNTLYGVTFPETTSIDERAAWCLSMLSSTTVGSRARLVREYPQGLLKLEPGDISRLAVRRPKTTVAARTLYRRATDLLMHGQLEAAQALADKWLE